MEELDCNPPISQVRGGVYYSTASLGLRGTNGYAWLSSTTAGGTGYNLNFNTGNIYPGTANGNKGSGLQLRCLVL